MTCGCQSVGNLPLAGAISMGMLNLKGNWDADTNTPALASGVGTEGDVYRVNVAGSTNLDGITDWKVGDWAFFLNSVWNKADNTDEVTSVHGRTGAVVAVTNDYTWAQIDKTISSIANITTKDHDLLSGLLDDDHTIYALLSGRSGGQALKGGTLTGDELQLQSNPLNDRPVLAFGGMQMQFGDLDLNGFELLGDTVSGGNLILKSTSNATKGKILLGTSAYDEVNNRLGINTASPDERGQIVSGNLLLDNNFGLMIKDFAEIKRTILSVDVVDDIQLGTTDLNDLIVSVGSKVGAWRTRATTGFTGFGTGGNVKRLVHISNPTDGDNLALLIDNRRDNDATTGQAVSLKFGLRGSENAAQIQVGKLGSYNLSSTTNNRSFMSLKTDDENSLVEGIRLEEGTKIGFFNTTAVVQPSHIVDASGGATVDAEARTAINALLAQHASLGLQAAS